MDISLVIRIILTLALIFGVYTETGIWTTIAMLLICATIELENYRRRQRK